MDSGTHSQQWGRLGEVLYAAWVADASALTIGLSASPLQKDGIMNALFLSALLLNLLL